MSVMRFPQVELVLCAIVMSLLSACAGEDASSPVAKQGTAPETQLDSDLQAAPSNEAVSLNNLGVGLMGRFEYDAARQAFEQALAMRPNDADLIVNLAIATLNRQREGDEDRALKLLAEALVMEPGHLRAIYCQGLLRLYLQSPELGQPSFEQVTSADSRDAYAAYYLGQCFAQQRRYEQAIAQYEKAIELDGRIRSAYYAASQAYRATGRNEDATRMLAEFQALDRHPQAKLAEFKYTRMGPKAMAQAIGVTDRHVVAGPDGPVFLNPQRLLANSDQLRWRTAFDDSERAISITAVDVDHDGDIDIFIANCFEGSDHVFNAVCINDGAGLFTLDIDHPFARVPNVNAALWGDFDNDGFTDVYFCRVGANMLWRQSAKDVWEDVTESTRTANGEFDSVDGAFFDADHDGDLDIFIVNANGPNELLNNNLDGTFRKIAAEAGITGSGGGSRQVIAVDLDNDRDIDIVVINNQPPHDVWINERAWTYRRLEGDDPSRYLSTHAVALDGDADGLPEFGYASGGSIGRVRHASESGWKNEPPAQQDGDRLAGTAGWLSAAMDANGSGSIDVVGARLLNGHAVRGWTLVNLDSAQGWSIVAYDAERGPMIWRPGPGRHAFASVSFSGRQVTSDNKQIRSNASGIGVQYAARVGSEWIAGTMVRNSSGPGQSLQPMAIGLGGAEKIDFLSTTWSDGVFQTELDLEAGKLHVIEETERQLSSCPVLFAWDGERYRFITDLLGVGGMGYLLSPGPPPTYATSRPWENLLLPEAVIQPKDGQFILKLGEPMEEACYLDSARLFAYDLPAGWNMTVDDRMHTGGGPEPTGAAMFYREASLRVPALAANDRGDDVTRSVAEADLIAADVGEVDQRFIGRLVREHALTLEFEACDSDDAPSTSSTRRWALIIDGWVEYPYSQTSFAAWQAGASYEAPTLEVRDENGGWTIVYEQFGYPAGFPRQMAMRLPDDLDCSGVMAFRLRTNQEIYFDRVALIEIEECAEAKRIELPMTHAMLADVGFALRTNGPQRQPDYDYDRRAPLWDTRHQRGWYSAFGDVRELVATQDDAMAVFGPGEEIEFRFDASVLNDLPENGRRRFVFESHGWCKDMDLYTKDGDTVEPLPRNLDSPDAALRDELHLRFNTRYQSGH